MPLQSDDPSRHAHTTGVRHTCMFTFRTRVKRTAGLGAGWTRTSPRHSPRASLPRDRGVARCPDGLGSMLGLRFPKNPHDMAFSKTRRPERGREKGELGAQKDLHENACMGWPPESRRRWHEQHGVSHHRCEPCSTSTWWGRPLRKRKRYSKYDRSRVAPRPVTSDNNVFIITINMIS